MLVLAVAAVALQSGARYNPSGPKVLVTLSGGRRFVIATDPKNYPGTVKGILALVRRRFYDGQRFHRVEDWVIQWGDPASKRLPMGSPALGEGGSGKQLRFEGGVVPFVRGVVGIASTGAQVGGDSQLFVLRKDALRLYNKYAVLGKVVSGMDVVDGVKLGDRIVSMRVLPSKPAATPTHRRPGRAQ